MTPAWASMTQKHAPDSWHSAESTSLACIYYKIEGSMGNHGCKFWAERRMGYHEGKLDCAIGLAIPARIHDVLQKDNPTSRARSNPMSTSARAASHPTNMPDLEGAPAGALNKHSAGFVLNKRLQALRWTETLQVLC